MQDEVAYIGITDTANFLGVSIDTLRRWDKKGILVAKRFSQNGKRFYRADDVANLKKASRRRRLLPKRALPK